MKTREEMSVIDWLEAGGDTTVALGIGALGGANWFWPVFLVWLLIRCGIPWPRWVAAPWRWSMIVIGAVMGVLLVLGTLGLLLLPLLYRGAKEVKYWA